MCSCSCNSCEGIDEHYQWDDLSEVKERYEYLLEFTCTECNALTNGNLYRYYEYHSYGCSKKPIIWSDKRKCCKRTYRQTHLKTCTEKEA